MRHASPTPAPTSANGSTPSTRTLGDPLNGMVSMGRRNTSRISCWGWEVAMGRSYVQLSPEVCDQLWSRLSSGMAAKPAARELGMSPGTVRAYLVRCGGIRPVPHRRAPCRLSLAEREEISRGLAAGASVRSIAAGLGRAPSTVSREVTRNGGPARYRAVVADRVTWSRAGRPKACKLATHPVLRDIVEAKLQARWSPEQIAGWLARRHPNDCLLYTSDAA